MFARWKKKKQEQKEELALKRSENSEKDSEKKSKELEPRPNEAAKKKDLSGSEKHEVVKKGEKQEVSKKCEKSEAVKKPTLKPWGSKVEKVNSDDDLKTQDIQTELLEPNSTCSPRNSPPLNAKATTTTIALPSSTLPSQSSKKNQRDHPQSGPEASKPPKTDAKSWKTVYINLGEGTPTAKSIWNKKSTRLARANENAEVAARPEKTQESGKESKRAISDPELNRQKRTKSRSLDLSKDKRRGKGKERKEKKKETKPLVYDTLPGLSLEEWAKTVDEGGLPLLLGQYQDIKKATPCTPLHTVVCDAHATKNRYVDVKCWDETRVVLKRDGDADDYIHANYVDGWKKPMEYICTQGPMEGTKEDFWDLIWQECVIFIIQLCCPIENGKQKCAEYWNNELNSSLRIGPYHIFTVHQEELNIMEHRILLTTLKARKEDKNAEKTEKPRKFFHYFHTNWPDKYYPKTAFPLLQLMSEVRKKCESLSEGRKNWNHGPFLVHCSAGIGRTGTLVAIDINYRRWMSTGKVDIGAVVEKIREQRSLAVQTDGQYVFTYRALLENAVQRKLLQNSHICYKDFLAACIAKFPQRE